MKVLFIVYNDGNGTGGHFHSLFHISSQLGKFLTVGIISIGKRPSPVIADSGYFIEHFDFQGVRHLWQLQVRFNSLIQEFKPEIVHFFDTESFNTILSINSLKEYPVVFNKCGGKNPIRSNWQRFDELILFSKENYNWFRGNGSYNNSRLHHIPNRVRGLEFQTKQWPEKKSENEFTFIRVTRLGGAYEKTLMDSFNLIEKLGSNFQVKLIVIGRIQDNQKFQGYVDYVKGKKLPVSFITDDRANKASDFLYLADAVIGTGRSLMEALSLGLPTLTPAKNSNFPILLTQENFFGFFDSNFSERNIATNSDLKDNYSVIKQLITDKKAYKSSSNLMLDLFNLHLSIDGIEKKYKGVYANALSSYGGSNKFLANILFVLKQFIGHL